MAEQLRESPPETAGNLIPGKWEADWGQGCDTYKELLQMYTGESNGTIQKGNQGGHATRRG